MLLHSNVFEERRNGVCRLAAAGGRGGRGGSVEVCHGIARPEYKMNTTFGLEKIIKKQTEPV